MAHYDSPEALSRICHRLVSRGRTLTVAGCRQLPTWSSIHRGHFPLKTDCPLPSQSGGKSKVSDPDALPWGLHRAPQPVGSPLLPPVLP